MELKYGARAPNAPPHLMMARAGHATQKWTDSGKTSQTSSTPFTLNYPGRTMIFIIQWTSAPTHTIAPYAANTTTSPTCATSRGVPRTSLVGDVAAAPTNLKTAVRCLAPWVGDYEETYGGM